MAVNGIVTLRASRQTITKDGRAIDFEYPRIQLSTNDEPKEKPNKDSKHILILGGGVSALTVAWILLDSGYRVTLVAEQWAWTKDFGKSRITSQIAGALWEYPPGGCGLTEIVSAGKGWSTLEHYQEWALQSYEFYKNYAEIQNSHERRGRSFGLNITQLHQFFFEPIELKRDTGRDPNANDSHAIKLQGIEEAVDDHRMHGYKRYRTKEDLEREFKDFSFSRDYRGGFKCGYTHDAPIINTDKAMAYLMALVKCKGANFETREIKGNLRDQGKGLLEIFDAHAVVNATGLGAKDLLGDEDVYPVRGAILRVDNTRNGQFNHLNDAYLVPAQKDNNGAPTGVVFIVPRNDDILYVGSIIQPHNDQANLEPGSPEVRVMWDRAGEFMPSLRHAEFVHHYPFAQGLRPFTKKNVKVRADTRAGFPLVHNYGHGGSGWTLGFGTARCAVYILNALLEEDYGEADEKWNQKAEKINEKVYGKED
ncbi:hypothetical protein CNMCM7691_002343 [Aspergillus felis]|uniref:FAD dependent oxidoreductase domain-containing protein n=1 Tax=Aspergillus felis TaxID=1287682 RepID=A0A8H6V9M2_9EURO|nr:hypothetical protein CNMCM7691_002343 [Aspergillus felis]